MPVKRAVIVALDPLLVRIETKLESLGQWHRAQSLRHHAATWRGKRRELHAWVQTLIEIDIRLREVVQRETFLLDQMRILTTKGEMRPPAAEELAQAVAWQEELDDPDIEYWRQERQTYVAESQCPWGPFLRGFFSYRQQQMWFLAEWLTADCAGRGGCCARGCGCCKRERSKTRAHRFGHCTTMCGCCQRRRGFQLTAQDRKLMQPPLNLVGVGDDTYSRGLLKGYIWGIPV
ncbi:hypothetical protein P168DRAFT_287404 [Aspergillus campestris IBT 28561]|uniref:Uncharacterized protein n=1 Tax=Aspergillus campestris (strain IBT 28561) TaxID=1392248 RepID=A0A2I1DHM9_ASPC2|nr:uncharacterized protein P168DRAFT_287404 [Aspergillus campestris IBT 28561]PKY09382.1 hypothetical protein P168DRAFT_287404 [Aspergillus campestris IBT 28561]